MAANRDPSIGVCHPKVVCSADPLASRPCLWQSRQDPRKANDVVRAKTLGAVASIATAMATIDGTARAEGRGYPSAAALLGYGFRDPAGIGLGVRAGYTLPVKVYVGGTFVYHFGSTYDTTFGKASQSVLYFGVEGGYEMEAGPVLVRPYLGLGDMIGSSSIPPTCAPTIGCIGGDTSFGSFVFWPGATVLYPLDDFFVGGDARFAIVTSQSSATVFSVFATAGLRF